MLGSYGAWIANTRWQAQGLWRFLGASALVVGMWGVFDWLAQEPRETPLYAYFLLALAPPILVGAWHVFARRRSVAAPLVILGGAILASITMLAVPLIAFVFP